MAEPLASPFQAGVAPQGVGPPAEAPLSEPFEEAPQHSTDPSAVEPGEASLELSPEQRKALTEELFDVVEAYKTAMTQRHERLNQIDSNYNLVVDASTTGQAAGSTQFVSEITRSHTNVATARLVETLLGTEPMFQVELLDESGDDAEELAAEAKASEEFLHNYLIYDMRGKIWLPMAIHRAAKTGAGVFRLRWEEKTRSYWYKGADGKPKKNQDPEGLITVELIGNRQMLVWPLFGLSIRDDSMVVGHEFFLTASAWRAFAAEYDVPEKLRDAIATQIMGRGKAETDAIRGRDEDLAGKDIDIRGADPFKGEGTFYDLWLRDYFLPEEEEAGNYHVILWEDGREMVFAEHNREWSQSHGYFLLPYWREDHSIWPSGVGHEVLFNHKADAALWNMFLDNVKVVGNVVRKVKAGSLAESQAESVQPGGTITYETNPEEFSTESLGGHEALGAIGEAMVRNEVRASKNSSVTRPEEGMADPVLKSGASPGSLQLLKESSGSKFTRIDSNMREPLSDLGMAILEMLQQYAPSSVFYTRASPENAEHLLRLKYQVPKGNLRRKFRIRPRAASATSNKELRKQTLLITYQLTVQHVQMMVGLIDMVVAPLNPPKALSMKEEHMAFLQNTLYRQVIEHQELPGVLGQVPKVETTPIDELYQQAMGELQQQNQLLEQQLQQVMEMMQGAAPAPGPQAPA